MLRRTAASLAIVLVSERTIRARAQPAPAAMLRSTATSLAMLDRKEIAAMDRASSGSRRRQDSLVGKEGVAVYGATAFDSASKGRDGLVGDGRGHDQGGASGRCGPKSCGEG